MQNANNAVILSKGENHFDLIDLDNYSEDAEVARDKGLAEQQGFEETEVLESPSLYLQRLPYVPVDQITYDSKNVIGKGGFAIVYKGMYQNTPAAIKRILIDSNSQDDVAHEIFVNTRLSHPCIVRMMGASRTATELLIANEYIQGNNLDAILHNQSAKVLDEETKQAIGFQVCLAVEYIHSKSIIHQDIKPGNIIVEEKGKRAFLTDWGMANIHDTVSLKIGSQTIVPPAGPLGGTIYYRAPECELHYNPATWHSDVWSVGATFVELFTGSRPWNVRQPREVKALLSSQTEPHALALLSPTWKDTINQCLMYEPEHRPTASTLAKVFRSGLDLQTLGW
ncbi:mitogen-activated protein kinase kinase kinase 2-like isoform X2 [Esox lucius]|uniref:mitogen-activated protein kinase kinase kinase 2-like isoform X2 n=1 Tax=Esox lucius TaxID=8010 RepID=UPI0010BDD342|nr:mitogen-activated protein kinase kinase kinase 2-like isoform X2 [Esox lucius]XP_034142731.1 mitogen-activated protein kinase kinase kinase 2-like isoform X2 [Esox lucius]XP_034142732.1 mitogen-activated protein kinase kinase kinase 2-like isoform X2 [Esox lucius]XP_034142733.1 mitogen-activated protein kinase kinase kinase 2-like isoform X2 [Esox lucius]